MRTALLAAAAAAVTLVLASPAFAHAIMSPPVAKAKVDQQFTLSVPTEEEGATTTEEELREFAREHLAHFKAPHRVNFVSELPKTATGKIQKYVLRGGRRAIAAQ